MKTPSIIYEDNYFAVIDKPSGWVVNRSGTISDVTLQDFVEESLKFENAESDSDFVKRSGIVHRLDRETSGLILCAKKEDVFKLLQKQFKARSVEKKYIALCHGKLEKSGEVEAPIGRNPKNRRKFVVIDGGRSAFTKFEVEKYYKHFEYPEGLSLVNIFPRTGRTHQIRVHMKYLNHPIFSDSLYVGRKMLKKDREHLDRLYLHASSITIDHPEKGRCKFETNLPSDLFAFNSTLE